MSTQAATLLFQAEMLLDGPDSRGRVHASRLAAFLARQALEELVEVRCVEVASDVGRASMASRLIVLRVLDEPDIADAANVAWNGLSNACHHHAYELTPTVGEVRHMCRLVTSLLPDNPAHGQL